MKSAGRPEPRTVRLHGRRGAPDEATLRRWARINWRPGKRVRPEWPFAIRDEIEQMKRERGASEPVYHGGRHPSGRAYVTVRQPGERATLLRWRLELYRHSPTGLEWGYGGSGPAQLALALLADATGDENLAISAHQEYKSAVVAGLSQAGWTLSRSQVLAWVKTYQKEKSANF